MKFFPGIFQRLCLFVDGGTYHKETSPLIWFLYDRDLHHERVKETHFLKHLTGRFPALKSQ